MSETAKLIEMVRGKLGASATADAIVTHLLSEGIIAPHRIRGYVIRIEFFRRMRSTTQTARDIECDLAAEFDLSVRHVRRIRTEFLKKGT